MRRKNLLKELGIQKQADTSCNARRYRKEANDYEIKKENITFVDSCNTYNWSYCCGGNRKDFNVDRFICITC